MTKRYQVPGHVFCVNWYLGKTTNNMFFWSSLNNYNKSEKYFQSSYLNTTWCYFKIMWHYRYLKTHFIYRSEVNVYVFIYDPVDSSLSQRPLQLHKAVHCSPALTHLHLLVQPLSLLHPHFNGSWQLCDASGRVINSGSQTRLALRTQPHSLRHGRG